MNVFEIERRRSEVLQDLVYCTTHRQKLFVVKKFFDVLLSGNSSVLFEAYSAEFIEIYISALSHYSPYFLHPCVTEDLLQQLKKLLAIDRLATYREQLNNEIADINEKLCCLKSNLAGEYKSDSVDKLCFPVLEVQSNTQKEIKAGMLETVTVKVSRGQREDKFIIVPLTGNPEEQMAEQINTSWQLAMSYVKRQIRRVGKFHEVIIHFDGRLGNYVGYSLGITLTIVFIEELLKFYNAPYLVNTKSSIALTGGIDINGKILPVGEQSIMSKIETVFYSGVNTFILPKKDERYAEEKLNELLQEFPERRLNLVSVSDLEDLLNRRNLIEIKKQNTVIRASRIAIKHWHTTIAVLLMLILAGYWYVRDFDDNPAILGMEGKILLVKNKSGKLLWNKHIDIDSEQINNMVLLTDIDADGYNEVITTGELNQQDIIESNAIICFNNKGKENWSYRFKDSIMSVGEILSRHYSIRGIIGNIDSVLYAIAINHESFSSALFRINIKNGQRLSGTLWHSGQITNGLIVDFDKDGKKEIYLNGINNSFDRAFLLGIESNFSNSQCPINRAYYKNKADYYLYKDLPLAQLKTYILFPKTDYNEIMNVRTNLPAEIGIKIDNDCLTCATQEDQNRFSVVGYALKRNLLELDITIGSTLKIRRDSLVSKRILKQPLTDTQEYKDILKSQIQYWNGKEFINRNEI